MKFNRYSRIPGHLRSTSRENAQKKALWLVEDFTFIVRKEDVEHETSVWLRVDVVSRIVNKMKTPNHVTFPLSGYYSETILSTYCTTSSGQ